MKLEVVNVCFCGQRQISCRYVCVCICNYLLCASHVVQPKVWLCPQSEGTCVSVCLGCQFVFVCMLVRACVRVCVSYMLHLPKLLLCRFLASFWQICVSRKSLRSVQHLLLIRCMMQPWAPACTHSHNTHIHDAGAALYGLLRSWQPIRHKGVFKVSKVTLKKSPWLDVQVRCDVVCAKPLENNLSIMAFKIIDVSNAYCM